MTPDETGLNEEEVSALKVEFEALDCVVTDLDEECFEISPKEYCVATHVYATPYFLQLSTMIIARPKGFPFRTRTKLYVFLNRANSSAKLAKFFLEGDKARPEFGGWMIMASVKFVSGNVGADWDRSVLKNCLNLWLQDIAEFVLLPAPFGFEMMKREHRQ